jgi:hypothetical protein
MEKSIAAVASPFIRFVSSLTISLNERTFGVDEG